MTTFLSARMGECLAKKVRRYLADRNILAKVTTDGITKIEVFLPPSWQIETPAMPWRERATARFADAARACGAFDWQIQNFDINIFGGA